MVSRRQILIGAGAGLFAPWVIACGERPTVREASAESSQYGAFPLATEFVVGRNRFPFTVLSADGLEAAGFAEVGKGVDLAQNDDITIQGRVPISTMGGLKGRGHPVGATGVYELVDLVTQLRGDAGENQVANAEIGMTQNIGGTGATVVTHILSR